ncbi:phospholipase [Sphingobacterium sp. DK4209]|uniref:Phospholipase n=1 Tax=Sphingobacterium zhuxiongii TaxID=2662364 RepID=A0A5Q0Q9E0_9SPHI|nr:MULTISPECIES: phospholipase [unclassified Sphingobacterium]MVZ66146.1 phospholipase [Sphingobacterium sp. DK4209]QGA26565.1 phospholipase [Sphingobacterium sp. dk4302]
MKPIYSRLTIMFFGLIGTLPLSAQKQSSNDIIIDSITFSQTRAKIVELPNGAFEKHVFEKQGKKLHYRQLLPINYSSHKKYPLVISLHNSSRIGDDNEKQLEHMAKVWQRPEIRSKYEAFVIVPQFNERSSNYVYDVEGNYISKPFTDIQLVLDLIKQFEDSHQVDASRIYLVGYSMGASTAQNLMSIAPDKFTALVSLAAVPDLSHIEALKKQNILLIHGQQDVDNPYAGSVALFQHLQGNKHLTFNSYTNLDHDTITIPFLLTDEIPAWLFKQKKAR